MDPANPTDSLTHQHSTPGHDGTSQEVTAPNTQRLRESGAGSLITLTEFYHRIINDWERTLLGLRSVTRDLLEGGEVRQARDAARFFGNAFSMFLSWGCDVRAGYGALEMISYPIIGLALRTTFDDITFQLQQVRDGNIGYESDSELVWTEASAELAGLIIFLQKQSRSIRVSDAIESGSGPLAGMERRIENVRYPEEIYYERPDDEEPDPALRALPSPNPSNLSSLRATANLSRYLLQSRRSDPYIASLGRPDLTALAEELDKSTTSQDEYCWSTPSPGT